MPKPRVLLIDCGSNFIDDLKISLLKKSSFLKSERFEGIDGLDFKEFDGVVISGSPTLFVNSDVKAYLKKISSCFNSGLPVLGICFGHQLLGLSFGSEVILGDLRKGYEEITILRDSALFNGIPKVFSQKKFHREEITLPESFKLIATSKTAEVEAMEHSSKPLFGVQFHPEISGDYGSRIINNFVGLLESWKTETGRK